MRVGIVGAGAIGLLFAYYFQKTADVTIYTRTSMQANEINNYGICYQGEERIFVKACKLEDAHISDDYLFVTVKQYQLEAVLPLLHNSKAKCVIFLQNGMAHVEVLKQFPVVAVGLVDHGAKREGNTVWHTGVGETRLGIVKGKEEWFSALLKTEKFPFVLEQDWQEVMEQKLIVNCCINPLTALYRVKNGELLSNLFFQHNMKRILKEVLETLGDVRMDEHWRRVCMVCHNTAENESSMFTDIKNRRETEVDAILGYVQTLAEKKEVETPLISFLYASIKGITAIS